MHSDRCTGFNGHRRITSGSLQAVVAKVKQELDSSAASSVLIFDDATGRLIDVDMQGSAEAVLARLSSLAWPVDRSDEQSAPAPKSRERGRPKLGVVAHEVTLLPRHWEWLAAQPGGASVTLRKLVEDARRAFSDKDIIRNRQNRAYNFLSVMTGDMPNFEEAVRALFANNQPRFRELVAAWLDDVRSYAIRLAFDDANLENG
ncbi:MAG: DUF2239 family protein [Chloroflexota bacterium]